MTLLSLNLHAWFAIIITVVMFGLLIFTNLKADIIFFGVIAALLLTGTLSPEETLSGFSNPSVVVIGVLFVVVAGLEYTGVLQWIVKNLLGTPKRFSSAILRIMIPAGLLSSVLSNTTVVALMLNVVKGWAKRINIAPSKLLMPLCFASCMGGVCTLIGTPPNLIISGLYAETTGVQMGIFTPTLVGIFCLFVGFLSMILLKKLLPERKTPDESLISTSEYTVELLVPTHSEYVGLSVSQAGLHTVKGGYLIEILRFDRDVISPVSEDEFIMGGDRLIYAGNLDDILSLKESHQLVSASHHVYDVKDVSRKGKLKSAYVSFSSKLIGKKMCNLPFEEENNIVLVAVAREGERINSSPREIKLKAGDVLLIEGEKINTEYLSKDLTFFDSEDVPMIGKKTLHASLIMVGMVLLSAFKVVPLLHSCFIAAFAMLFTRCCTLEQAKKSINWDVLMVFAGSVCLGKAIESSGLAELIANGLLNLTGTNPLIALIAVAAVATLLTEVISNTAAAAVLFPIAFQTATACGANPMTFCICLMVAASFGFASPIGSPTHILIFGPGGYKVSDFFKVGLPFDVIMLIANIFIVTMLFPL